MRSMYSQKGTEYSSEHHSSMTGIRILLEITATGHLGQVFMIMSIRKS